MKKRIAERAKKIIRTFNILNDNRDIGNNFILWSFIKLFASLGKLTQAAAALTYHTLFAIVPILALMLATAVLMGYGDAFKDVVQEIFSNQEGLAKEMLVFTESYLENARTGYWLGAIAGFSVLLYSLFSIFQTIDETFNSLWEMKGHSLKNQLKVFFFTLLIPVALILLLAIRASVSAYFEGGILSEVNFMLASTSAYVLTLFASYKFIPKVHVRTRYAAISATVCGITFAIMQYFGAFILGLFTSYHNIYGKLAGILLLLLWIYFSWIICLVGSRWNYLLQESKRLDQKNRFRAASHNYHKFLKLLVIARCEEDTMRKGDGTFDSLMVADAMAERYDLPQHITMEILETLTRIGIIIVDDEENYQLSPEYRTYTVRRLVGSLDSIGDNDYAAHITAEAGSKERALWEFINDKEGKGGDRFDNTLDYLL